jgi:mxaA protein
VSAATFFISTLSLAYLYGYIQLPHRQIFSRANRQLNNLTEHDLQQGLTILHQALNKLNQKPLFAHQLPQFYQTHPHYQAANALLEAFFASSSGYFFSGNAVNADETWQVLRNCCQLCAKIERGQQ